MRGLPRRRRPRDSVRGRGAPAVGPRSGSRGPDLGNQIAARPPALLDLGRYLAGASSEADLAFMSQRGGPPWALQPPPSPVSTSLRIPWLPAPSFWRAR